MLQMLNLLAATLNLSRAALHLCHKRTHSQMEILAEQQRSYTFPGVIL